MSEHKMTSHSFPQGMTVKELKAALADWPDEGGFGDTEVWIDCGDGTSSVVIGIEILNYRGKEGAYHADMLLICSP